MAYNGGQLNRPGEMRYGLGQTVREEMPLLPYPSTLRQNGQATASMNQNDPRISLQRRFTTESTRLHTMPAMGHLQRATMIPVDLTSSTHHKIQLLEKKRNEAEKLMRQAERFKAEMELIELRQKKEEAEIQDLTAALGQTTMSAGAGYQSEPTTPPEYRDSGTGFPSTLSRPNRFSLSSLTSPPGLANRASRSGSQLISPPAAERNYNSSSSGMMPSKSVPGSRRNSDEDEPGPISPPAPRTHSHRSARNSMPAAILRFSSHHDHSGMATMGLGQINTTKYLFGDDENEKLNGKSDPKSTTSPKMKSYLSMNATDDNFPILVRHEEYPGMLSASSAALDLALSQSPGPEAQSNGWPSFSRHRPQHSLPLNALSIQQHLSPGLKSTNSIMDRPSSPASNGPPGHGSHLDRLSRDLDFRPSVGSSQSLSSSILSPNSFENAHPKLTASYSTNDIPTFKENLGMSNAPIGANSRAQQHFHNHNASLGRIPARATNHRHSREVSSGAEQMMGLREGQGQNANNNPAYQPFQSALQANAPAFGPPSSSAPRPNTALGPAMSQTAPAYPNPGYYGGYGGMVIPPMAVTGLQMHGMGMEGQFFQGNPYGFPPYGGYSRGLALQPTRVLAPPKRNPDSDANRFANVQLDSLRGEIYGLCKDQHGCRYLQKKLEERDPDSIQTIFLETNPHVVELMTDPFGNYLCQKLLEYSNDEQRTVLINNAAPSLVNIALNQHGTRALQKMIEFVSTSEQIQTIIFSLQNRVVELIQDLNGNHVIQKCLNRLSSGDARFIFDAVGEHCVVVGTHRHGCCVLQRCIDHASGVQKANLIAQISSNAFPLVQDPFGNYVVQYILDLGEAAYTEPLIQSFLGHVPALSKQKFSSNVIEKCLRTADSPMKQLLIEEMLQSNELERMLRDSYANYVIQTAMDFADLDIKRRLVDNIRPLLPAIRSTPYGRRIQGKIQALDNRSGGSSGQITPNETSSLESISLTGQRQLSATSTPQRHLSSTLSHASNFGDHHAVGYGGGSGYELTQGNHTGLHSLMSGDPAMSAIGPTNFKAGTSNQTGAPTSSTSVRYGGPTTHSPSAYPHANQNHTHNPANFLPQPFTPSGPTDYGRNGVQPSGGNGMAGTSNSYQV